jgi:hypothetical protein
MPWCAAAEQGEGVVRAVGLITPVVLELEVVGPDTCLSAAVSKSAVGLAECDSVPNHASDPGRRSYPLPLGVAPRR